MALTGAEVWRDWTTDGIPSSGEHDPRKPDIRAWALWLENIVNAFISAGGYIFETKADLETTSSPPNHAIAWVVNDPVAANNGVYRHVGVDSLVWVRMADLPYSFIAAEDSGSGTPNAIQATSSLPISGSALVLLNVYETNGPGPTTVQFNGGAVYTIKTNSGNDPVEGGLPEGMIVMGRVSGSTFRLVSDQASAALLAQMESILLDFEQKYLGAHADDAAATADAGGTPFEGATYWNSTVGMMRVWHSSAWLNQSIALNDGDVTFPKLAAEVAIRLIEFDIRDSQFAGGAPMNGIDDDSPAIQAAVDYAKTLGGRYSGGMASIRLPRGGIRLEASIALEEADNVSIDGEGAGATTVNLVGNIPGFVSTAGLAQSLYRTSFSDFTVYGPGRDQLLAYAFDIEALNEGRFDEVQVYACRRAWFLKNQWQTTLNNVRAAAPNGNALSCYDGLYMGDGDLSIAENAILAIGGLIQGCERYAMRGECLTGSKLYGLELLDAGVAGAYWGDSPGGKDLKWITSVGMVIDTCPDLFIANRGGAAFAGDIHLSVGWFGYASSGSGQGEAIRLNSIQNSTFRPDKIINVDVAINAVDCANVDFEPGVITDYDRSLVGAVPIILDGSINCVVRSGPVKKASGSPGTLVASEVGAVSGNFFDIPVADGGMSLAANTAARGNPNYKTRNRGSATIASGTSSIVVNHGLGRQPVQGEIIVTPQHTLSSAGAATFAVDTFTATTFTIRVNANVTGAVGFSWSADVSRGF